MFRLTPYLKELDQPSPLNPRRAAAGPVVIWNLIRRCNLNCKHCYSLSADTDFPGELSTQQVFGVIDDLYDFGVRVLILSGGEPLLRRDIFEVTRYAKERGFFVGLSTNGTIIGQHNIDSIADSGFDYVGISLDGLRDTHDRFRRKPGAFDATLQGIRLCVAHGLKVGLRFTLTQNNAADLPALLKLMDEEGATKFYLSHLNYAGRGNRNRRDDAHSVTTRQAVDLLIATAWTAVRARQEKEFVTGNNDADAVYLLHWAATRFAPEQVAHLRTKLEQWGGNASGMNIANIDNVGNVHPDTMWWSHTLGNVKHRPFSEIWRDASDPLIRGLRQSPRPVQGRCRTCTFLSVCGGNTRTRAMQLTGNPWAEDPGCYLDDQEIQGLPNMTGTVAHL